MASEMAKALTPVAEIELTAQEMGQAVAERISHTRLTPSHFWNTYTLQIKVHNGEFVGGTVRYYLDEEDLTDEARRDLEERRKAVGQSDAEA